MDVVFITTTSDKLDSVPIVDGQVIALSDVDAYYYDMGSTRRSATSHQVVSELPSVGVPGTTYILTSDGMNKDDGFYVWQNSNFVKVVDRNEVMVVTFDDSARANFTYSQITAWADEGKPVIAVFNRQVYNYIDDMVIPGWGHYPCFHCVTLESGCETPSHYTDLTLVRKEFIGVDAYDDGYQWVEQTESYVLGDIFLSETKNISSLNTTSKTVPGAINELKEGIDEQHAIHIYPTVDSLNQAANGYQFTGTPILTSEDLAKLVAIASYDDPTSATVYADVSSSGITCSLGQGDMAYDATTGQLTARWNYMAVASQGSVTGYSLILVMLNGSVRTSSFTMSNMSALTNTTYTEIGSKSILNAIADLQASEPMVVTLDSSYSSTNYTAAQIYSAIDNGRRDILFVYDDYCYSISSVEGSSPYYITAVTWLEEDKTLISIQFIVTESSFVRTNLYETTVLDDSVYSDIGNKSVLNAIAELQSAQSAQTGISTVDFTTTSSFAAVQCTSTLSTEQVRALYNNLIEGTLTYTLDSTTNILRSTEVKTVGSAENGSIVYKFVTDDAKLIIVTQTISSYQETNIGIKTIDLSTTFPVDIVIDWSSWEITSISEHCLDVVAAAASGKKILPMLHLSDGGEYYTGQVRVFADWVQYEFDFRMYQYYVQDYREEGQVDLSSNTYLGWDRLGNLTTIEASGSMLTPEPDFLSPGNKYPYQGYASQNLIDKGRIRNKTHGLDYTFDDAIYEGTVCDQNYAQVNDDLGLVFTDAFTGTFSQGSTYMICVERAEANWNSAVLPRVFGLGVATSSTEIKFNPAVSEDAKFIIDKWELQVTSTNRVYVQFTDPSTLQCVFFDVEDPSSVGQGSLTSQMTSMLKLTIWPVTCTPIPLNKKYLPESDIREWIQDEISSSGGGSIETTYQSFEDNNDTCYGLVTVTKSGDVARITAELHSKSGVYDDSTIQLTASGLYNLIPGNVATSSFTQVSIQEYDSDTGNSTWITVPCHITWGSDNLFKVIVYQPVTCEGTSSTLYVDITVIDYSAPE